MRPQSVLDGGDRDSVVLFDDDPGFLRQLSDVCHPLGIVVRTLSRATLETWTRDTPQHLRGIVLEPGGPGGNWYQSLMRIRVAATRVPLVVVTAYWSSAMQAEAALTGAVACMRKPAVVQEVVAHLGFAGHSEAEQNRHSPTPPNGTPLCTDLLALSEWEHINNILRRCGGNMSKAAAVLGIQRPTLYKKLGKHPPWPPGQNESGPRSPVEESQSMLSRCARCTSRSSRPDA